MHAIGTTYRKVLVVDDDAIMRELLTALLGIEGYEVQTAESGEEALKLLASGAELDIILADLHMPGLHGPELVERLNRARPWNTLLIAMSGSKLKNEHAGLFGAFLQKPFTVEDFVQAIETAKGQTAAAEASGEKASPATPSSVLDDDIFGRMAAMLPAAQLKELYKITIDDVLRRVRLMRAGLENGDHAAIRAEAHAIKGGCGMVGARELSSLATEVEAGTGEGSQKGNPPFADFDAACSRLQVMLDARFSENVETA
jgi:CheY-like chemotaxis protein/HPt (histidine-containing phosphotransfer) domain-containing protein